MGAVGAKDVEGHGPNAGYDAGPGADAAGVLTERHVADIMGTVLNTPPEARGLGLAAPFLTEVIATVFGGTVFERLELNVYTFNTAAIRTYKKLGFVCEGVWRSLAKMEGERWDAAHYSMIRSGYRQAADPRNMASEGD